MKFDNIHNVYFLGIGGIGMSALARWFNAHEFKVAGYDKTATTLTKALEKEGVVVHYEDDIKLIAKEFFNKENTLIVYTPAIPSEHVELNYFKLNKFELKKRSEVLGLITAQVFTIAVAGTHGKTTTSSMIAHMLTEAGKNCFAFLGGITQNYNTNLLLGDKSENPPVMVVEADEYDRSFLQLKPEIAVITTMDPDHLDIYLDEDDFIKTFHDFIDKVELGGKVIYREDLPVERNEIKDVEYLSFGLGEAEYKAQNVHIENGEFIFDVKMPDSTVEFDVRIQVPGYHNVLNSLAAFAVGQELGIPTGIVKSALKTFRGVKRRFEYHVKNENVIYIDDYAHHPTEITAFLKSVKALYAGKKVTIIFQPHLYSRTRDFMQGFAESLSIADQVVLLDIYPARELPIPGVTSEALLEKVKSKDKILCNKSELMKVLENINSDIIATVGAGDIDQFIGPIKEHLERRKYA